MRALVTRPRADADAVARALEARGLEVMVEPLLDITPVPGATVDLNGVQAILVTSANGVRALANTVARRDLPVWAVGEATAAEARRVGFGRVESAGGDVESLAALVAARVDPTAGTLLHASGHDLAGELASLLLGRGFAVRRAVLYDARPVKSFSPALIEALRGRTLDLALFFSPRTAATFVRLARSAGLDGAAVRAYALSAAVAGALASLPWQTVRVAERPTQEALLAALDADLATRRAGNGSGGGNAS